MTLRDLGSTANPHVKAARRLHTRKGRAASGLVLIEGRRLVSAALAAAVPIEAVFATDPSDPLLDAGEDAFVVDEKLLAHIAATSGPQGLVATAAWAPQRFGGAREARRVLVLDAIADPGNAGTLVRTAAALGLDEVVFTTGSCDPTNPKALRASAGAMFAIPVATGVSPNTLLDGPWLHVGAGTAGGEDVRTVGSPESWALWVGSEARGFSAGAEARLDHVVTIPLARGVESLNVSAAGAILLAALAGVL